MTIPATGTGVGDKGAEMLRTMHQLEDLDAADLAVTDAGLGHLALLDRRRSRRYQTESDRAAGLAKLSRVKTLRNLVLAGIPLSSVSVPGTLELQEKLPWCLIHSGR